MDYYEVLKVLNGARQAELDRAYQKLIKEARYDNSINRKEIETAYRTLSDATQRALYDATQADKAKRAQQSLKMKKPVLRGPLDRQRPLKISLAILFLIALIYYPLRFGYQLKNFEVGDSLYFKDTSRYFGKISRIENNHDFGLAKTDGYLIKVSDDAEIWWPANDVKSLCLKK